MASGYVIHAETELGALVLTHRLTGSNDTWEQYKKNPERVARAVTEAAKLVDFTDEVAIFNITRTDLKNQKAVKVTYHRYSPCLNAGAS